MGSLIVLAAAIIASPLILTKPLVSKSTIKILGSRSGYRAANCSRLDLRVIISLPNDAIANKLSNLLLV